jgi:para-nitrobenzyl esterase
MFLNNLAANKIIVRLVKERKMSTQKNTVVNTQYGKIEGIFENGLYSFKGLPYAAPPVGDLRWLPPQPLQPWKGTRKAHKFGTIAPQNVMPGGPPGMSGVVEVESQSEDCLFLNIFTPGLDSARRPVMVWVHGGGFSIGSGSEARHRGMALPARGDVVLVTLNYRLGVLGFLNLNKVTGGKIPATGNEGLLDQIAALGWVRDNVAAFGGDPANVTVFGESAGGMSIGCLMNMPKARGLFHKAIIESAVGEMSRPLDLSVRGTEELLKILGVGASDVKALRALKVEKILSAQAELAVRTGQGLAMAIPVADGKDLPQMPLDSFAAGLAAKIPSLIGSNLDEQKLFSLMDPHFPKMDESDLTKYVERAAGAKNAPALIAAYRKARSVRGEPVTPPEMFSAMNSDLMFRRTALLMVQAQHKYGQPVYNYLFTWKSPALGGALGACHSLEIGFVFGNYDPNFCGSGPAADKLAGQIQDAWIAFARTGNPSCESLGVWPQFGSEKQTMVLGPESHVEIEPYSERRIWDTVKKVALASLP